MSSIYNKSKNGFTLIELLVVIAIIALLVSILLPSLKTAKDLARSVVCMSNLKSLNTAINFYTSDYDGCMYTAYEAKDILRGIFTPHWPWAMGILGYTACPGSGHESDIFNCPIEKEAAAVDGATKVYWTYLRMQNGGKQLPLQAGSALTTLPIR